MEHSIKLKIRKVILATLKVFLLYFFPFYQIYGTYNSFSSSAIFPLVLFFSYIAVTPLIIWVLEKLTKKWTPATLWGIAMVSSAILAECVRYFIKTDDEIIKYFSTLLITVFLYFVCGNNCWTTAIKDIKTLKGSFFFSSYMMSKFYRQIPLRALIFGFYLFTLIFGQLRDLGIHHYQIFKYEQYAIIILIALDRIIRSFTYNKTKMERFKKISQLEEAEDFNEQLTTKIAEGFTLVLKDDPSFDIDKLDDDLWGHGSDETHPKTQLLCTMLLTTWMYSEAFKKATPKNKDEEAVISEGAHEAVKRLFIKIGKDTKRKMFDEKTSNKDLETVPNQS